MKFFGRKVVKLSLLILLQLIAIVSLINFASHKTIIYNLVIIITLFIGISLLSKDYLNPVYKIMWLLVLVLLPVLGTVFYLIWGDRKIPKRKAEMLSNLEKKGTFALNNYGNIIDANLMLSGGERASANYLYKYANAPVYKDTEAVYYSSGEKFFADLLAELKKARRFIFMEYFIIKDGKMWNEVFSVLKEKAAHGVKIKLLYDAFGCMFELPDNFSSLMRENGIKCHRFNAVKFSWNISDYTFINHRDHRKICIIDGNVGFTGGINIADEYINVTSPHGYWKDSAVKISGQGVFSMTVSFLRMWEAVDGKPLNYNDFIPTVKHEADFYVQPYEDSPLDVENVSENSYFNVINRSRKYVYIVTPYLIIDNEMLVSLSLAAKSGVDVKIILPGVPDKKYVYLLTQSYYSELLKAGVKIYEYTPGFVHAKMFVRDDEQAIVGSANMDYRSLYLHFEYCCSFYGGHIVKDVKSDILDIISKCHEVTLSDINKTSALKRGIQKILKFFAPLM